MRYKTIPPGKQSPTITTILASSASFHVGFPVGLNCVFLGAPLALILLLAMLPAEMFLDSGEITEGSRGIMMNASGLRADINPLSYIFTGSLPEFPRQVVAPPVKL